MAAYAELDSLVALEYKARGFSLRHTQPVHSLLFGRRASHVRGRGLDFEELRNYVAGDDVRAIDWRVTARMRKPYIRVYSEERDRPAMLVVDQRINMFFGSRRSMKSVVAAEITALAAWRVFTQGDRVGAFVFNDVTIEQVRMHRSRATVLRVLDRVTTLNKQLRSDSTAPAGPEKLNEVLDKVARICHHDTLILIASDFDGADSKTRDLLLHLSQSNDVICALAYNPLAVQSLSSEQVVVSNATLQVELRLNEQKIREGLLSASDERLKNVLSWQRELNIPVLPLSTADDVSQQLRHQLGHIAAHGRRL
jgi:uncharacterized protein (DUF58 family)